MKLLHQQRLFAVTAAAAFVAALSASAFAASESGPKTTIAPGSPNPAVEAQVPDNYKAKGSLTVAVSATHPPNAYFSDENKLVGWEVELGRALAARMGLKADFQKVQFVQILTGLQSGR
ncbi:MAG: transporter substrate-binding domain-containing protein, partial [Pararhizobium sp.]